MRVALAFSGTDCFTYRVSGGSLESNVATLTMTINATTGPRSSNEPDGTGEESNSSSDDEDEPGTFLPHTVKTDVERPTAKQTHEPRD
jgi:hypothetical protein